MAQFASGMCRWAKMSARARNWRNGGRTPARYCGRSPSALTARLWPAAVRNQLIRLWDTRSGENTRTLSGHSGTVGSTAFSPDGRILVSASGDQTVRIWDIESGQCLQELWDIARQSITLPSTQRFTILASCSEDETIRLWDVETGDCRNVIYHIDKHYERMNITGVTGSDRAQTGVADSPWRCRRSVIVGGQRCVAIGHRSAREPLPDAVVLSISGRTLSKILLHCRLRSSAVFQFWIQSVVFLHPELVLPHRCLRFVILHLRHTWSLSSPSST